MYQIQTKPITQKNQFHVQQNPYHTHNYSYNNNGNAGRGNLRDSNAYHHTSMQDYGNQAGGYSRNREFAQVRNQRSRHQSRASYSIDRDPLSNKYQRQVKEPERNNNPNIANSRRSSIFNQLANYNRQKTEPKQLEYTQIRTPRNNSRLNNQTMNLRTERKQPQSHHKQIQQYAPMYTTRQSRYSRQVPTFRQPTTQAKEVRDMRREEQQRQKYAISRRKPNILQPRNTANRRNITQPISNSQQKLLCIDCFNSELYHARQRKKLRQKAKQKQIQRKLNKIAQANRQKQNNLIARQYQKTIQFNKNKVQQDRINKYQQQRIDRQNQQRVRRQIDQDNRLRMQDQARVIHNKREKIRQQLEEQIKRRRERLMEESLEERNEVIQAQKNIMFDEKVKRELRADFQQRYRQDLLKQINDDRNRKRNKQTQQRLKNIQQAQLLAQQARQRDRIKAEQVQRKRANLLQQAKARKQYKQQAKRQQLQRKQREQYENMLQKQENSRIRRQNQVLKKNRLNQYLNDLRDQIQLHQIKKQEQEQYNKIPAGNLLRKKTTICQLECDGCEGIYPEKFFTRVVQPFQIE